MSHRNSDRVRRKRRSQRMTLVALAGGVLLVAAAVFALRPSGSATIEVTGQPKLKAEPDKVDLGDVRLGQTVTTQFVLTNVGDQSLAFNQEPYVEVVEGC